MSFVISELKPAVRDAARVNVFVNGKFEFSLTLAEVVDYGVKQGMELTAERLEELRGVSELGKLTQRTLEWALVRPRSVKETRDYLVRKQRTRAAAAKRYVEFQERLRLDAEYREFVKERRKKVNEANKKLRQRRERAADEGGPDYAENNTYEYAGRARTGLPSKPAAEISDEQIKKVVQKLIEMGAVDDKKFAQWFAENRKAKAGASRRRLQLELARKGIGREAAETALAEAGRDELAEAKKMAEKKWKHYKGDERKVMSYLVRQGFSFEIAREAIENNDE